MENVACLAWMCSRNRRVGQGRRLELARRRAAISARCAPMRGNVLWRFILEPLVSLLKIALLIVRSALYK